MGLAVASLLTLPLASEAITWDAGDLKVNFHGSLRPSINADDCSSPCKGGWRGGPAGESLAGKKSTYMTSNFSHIQFDGSYKLNEKNAAVFKTEWKIEITDANTVPLTVTAIHLQPRIRWSISSSISVSREATVCSDLVRF